MIKLGEKVRDRISGKVYLVIARMEKLYCAPAVLLWSQAENTSAWIEETQCELVAKETKLSNVTNFPNPI